MKALRKTVVEYLELRRGLGFKLDRIETRLGQFLSFMDERRTSRITTDLALEFATQDPRLSPATVSERLSAVRGFARYRRGIDSATEIPPLGLLPKKQQPALPYIYSETEITRLLEGAKNYPSWNRFSGPWWARFQGWTFYCIFGLLAVTGMRIGEVLNLRTADIDWSEGVLTIRNAKFGKSRLVPLHHSTLKTLGTFVQHRDRFFARLNPQPEVAQLFVTSRGSRLDVRQVNQVFLCISRQIGLRAPDASHGPRLHDFRHRFAVETLLRWYRDDEPVDRLLPVLSTYLGHTHVTGTYWYLRCTPELMAAAGERLEERWKGVE
jgi:integrase/recombinase XerD